jgi:hypothetical protein
MTYEISGWSPDWQQVPSDLLTEHRERLRALRGNRIDATWLVWINDLDEWFADLPIALQIGGQQLEICNQKFDDLSVTWNTIDVDVAPIAWVDWSLTWRRDAHAALQQAVGQTIRNVYLSEHLFTTSRVHPPDPLQQHDTSAWLLGGLVFELDSGYLHVFNALDENGLSAGAPETGPSNRMIMV